MSQAAQVQSAMVLVLLALMTCCQANPDDPDVNLNVTLLITTKGYPCIEYNVTTEDGFILGVQRIPFGHQRSMLRDESSRPAVFLQHGLLDSSATWVINSNSQSLGFLLADAGFDVWLGNIRGNTYSRSHKKFSPSDSQFWDWSWDEMAKYDLPAMVKFVTEVTGKESIFYIGHSQGAMIALAKFSLDQGLANKAYSQRSGWVTAGWVNRGESRSSGDMGRERLHVAGGLRVCKCMLVF